MKKLTTLLAFLFTIVAFAQVPDRMSYQTVVRNSDGILVTSADISVQISIFKGNKNSDAIYTEVHKTVTNTNGLASFNIGNGIVSKGTFGEIDWINGPYFIETSTDPRGGSNYEIVGVSELLSVPYALSARTAENVFSGNYEDLENRPLNLSEFINDLGFISEKASNGKAVDKGIPSQNWSLFGNSKSDPLKDKLGTSDYQDLVLVTDNIDRFRINANGDINIAKSLKIGENLTVNKNVDLNILGGATVNNGNFTVENTSETSLTGTLTVDGATTLQSTLDVKNAAATNLTGTLIVDGETNLNSSLDVNNAATTNLTGTLNVIEATSLQSTLDVKNAAATNLTGILTVDGITNLNSSLDVKNSAATKLSGTLNVTGATILNNTLATKGQVTIDVNVAGGEGSYNAYPLRVQGSGQGVAIKLSAGTPNNSNNFITFFNSSGGAVGRIEGETNSEVSSDPQFIYDEAILVAEEVVAIANVVLAAIPVVVAGFGASGGPCGACLAIEAANVILATANLAAYNIFAHENLGVTYQSGSADYAEWLQKFDPNENIDAGEIVGVTSGKISKFTGNSRQYMVISTKPAILGNMPQQGQEYLYEKVAFMGQIPVKVSGTVISGDYILPSGLNDGIGIAVSPDEIAAEQYQKIVGVAWSSSFINNGVSTINMAIGLNSNDVAALAIKQEKKISDLEAKFASFEEKLTALEEGTEYNPGEGATKEGDEAPAAKDKLSRKEIIAANMPSELNDAVLNDAMIYLRDQFQQKNIDIENHPGLNKLFNDSVYQQEIFQKTKQNYRNSYQKILNNIED